MICNHNGQPPKYSANIFVMKCAPACVGAIQGVILWRWPNGSQSLRLNIIPRLGKPVLESLICCVRDGESGRQRFVVLVCAVSVAHTLRQATRTDAFSYASGVAKDWSCGGESVCRLHCRVQSSALVCTLSPSPEALKSVVSLVFMTTGFNHNEWYGHSHPNALTLATHNHFRPAAVTRCLNTGLLMGLPTV